MEALRVPTLPIETEVLLTGGERVRGVLRLPAAAELGGPPSLAEWLNGEESFFPFQPQGRDDFLLLNKHEVLVVSAPPDASGAETPEGVDVPRRPVTVELEGFRYSGFVTVDLPEQHSRTLDVFNRPEAFLTLHSGESDHVVNKRRIARVEEGR